MKAKQQKLAIVIDGATGYLIDGSGAIIATRPAEVLVSCTRDEAIAAVKNYKKAQEDAKHAQQQWQLDKAWADVARELIGRHNYLKSYAEQDPWKMQCATMAQVNRYRVKANVVRKPKERIDQTWDEAVLRLRQKHNHDRVYYAEANVWKRWAGNKASNNTKRQKRKAAQVERDADITA